MLAYFLKTFPLFVALFAYLPTAQAFMSDGKMTLEVCKSRVEAMNCSKCEPDPRSYYKFEVNVSSSLVSISEFVDEELVDTKRLSECKIVSKDNWECRQILFDHVSVWGTHETLDTTYAYVNKVLRISKTRTIDRAHHGEESRGILHDGSKHICAKKSLF